ncbi:MAG: NAD-binding protein [Spirochaetia bacterium]|nr:NAD-binding protein [Spirochaetia bacterium]
MTIAILGADKVAIRLAKTLIEENYDVIIFEKDQEKAAAASNALDCMVVNKDGLDIDNLRSAGVDKAEYFISLTGSDERNLIICGLVDREFHIKNTIAQVRKINFSHKTLLDQSFLGIDYIVNPELEAAKAIIDKVEHGATGDIILFENTTFQIRNLQITAECIFAGRQLKELKNVVNEPILLALIMRDGKYIIPRGDTVINPGDTCYILGTEEALSIVMNMMGKTKINLNKLVIVGGNDISSYVCEHFYNKGISHKNRNKKFFWNFLSKKIIQQNITIIDRDYSVCKVLAEKFPDALILNEDISDDNVLEDEGLTDSDLIIASTANQELNMVTAVYAKSLGIKKSLALVNKDSYLRVASNLGIDVPVSINSSTLQGILGFMRRSTIKSSHSIPESDIEVIQLQVTETSMSAGMYIKDLNFPPETLLLAVRSRDKDILPNGNYQIKKLDNIILLVKKDNIEKVQNMFTD